MDMISGVTGGAGYRPAYTQPTSAGSTHGLRASGSLGVPGPTSAGTMRAGQGVADVLTGVGELLNSIGGGVENDKLLQLLIVLLILTALLDNQQGRAADNGQILRSLGSERAAAGQTISMYSSSTTISIQQTDIAVVMGGAFDAGGQGEGAPGGTLDVVA
ncbi:MAG: hypothetical protein ACE5HE_02440 [Phycisphaerae bacterium]